MKAISPFTFCDRFENIVKQEAAVLADTWTNRRSLTMGMRRSIFPKLAESLGQQWYCEYWGLDAVFYAQKDTKHFRQDATYAKYISVALEHENAPRWSTTEMNKLQIFNTPLKVLITYPGSGEAGAELLKSYSEIVADADIFEDISSLRRQLVIFGYRDGSNLPSWEGFVYHEGEFVPVRETS